MNLIDESPIASQLETIQECHIEKIRNDEFGSCQLDDQSDMESPTKQPEVDVEPEDPNETETEVLVDLFMYCLVKIVVAVVRARIRKEMMMSVSE